MKNNQLKKCGIKIYTRENIQSVYKQFSICPASVVYSIDGGYTWKTPPMDTGKWFEYSDENEWVFTFLNFENKKTNESVVKFSDFKVSDFKINEFLNQKNTFGDPDFMFFKLDGKNVEKNITKYFGSLEYNGKEYIGYIGLNNNNFAYEYDLKDANGDNFEPYDHFDDFDKLIEEVVGI